MSNKRQSNLIVRESITLALLQLMKIKPFRDISIIELTERAGVARVSFYRSFPSKEDVLIAHLGEKTKEWAAGFRRAGKPDIMLSLFRHFADMKELILLLYSADLSHLLIQHFRNCCGLDKDQPKELAYWNARLAAGMYGWCDEWVRRGMIESPEEMAEMYANQYDQVVSLANLSRKA